LSTVAVEAAIASKTPLPGSISRVHVIIKDGQPSLSLANNGATAFALTIHMCDAAKPVPSGSACAKVPLLLKADLPLHSSGKMGRIKFRPLVAFLDHQNVQIIDGKRVEWTDFGAVLIAFEGWQFRLELLDPSDEA
jgi:hypothetical protein